MRGDHQGDKGMEQQPPRGDARYRVYRSVRFYVAELMVGTGGATWYFNDSKQRVVYRTPDGIENVVYKTIYYPLQSAERMIEIAENHSRLPGGTVIIGGKPIYADDDDREFAPYPFIDITHPSEHERFRAIIAGVKA